ncbi:DNA-binding protein [Nonomuraea antimicrobica]
MSRKQDTTHTGRTDHAQADHEHDASERLLRLGADALDARPWRPAPAPPTAVDLVQFAVWRNADLNPDDVLSALALLPAARAEVEGLESALLFIARSAGLTWAQMANAMGFNSPQACQQHYTRLTTRQDADS